TVVVMAVGVIDRTIAATPPKATWVAPGTNPLPVIVTNVPTGPLEGLRLASTGRRATANVSIAGVGSSLPARSRAFTSNVWAPSTSPVTVALVDAEKTPKTPPSIR